MKKEILIPLFEKNKIMNTKNLFIYGMLLFASVLLVVSTSCEKDDDPPSVANGDNGNNGNGDIDYGEMTDSRDGRTYKTIEIGDQVWMAENIAYLPEITYADDWGSDTEPQYAVYGYLPGSGTETVAGAKAFEHYNNYGVLYNWTAAMAGEESSELNPNGVQGICPDGWHLPSDDEWTQLVDYVVAQGYPNEWDNPNGAGNALKSCRQVDSPLGGNCDTSEHPRWNSHDTHSGFDEFGFTAIPGGRDIAGFFFIGFYGGWWNTTENGTSYAWANVMYPNSGSVNRASWGKEMGFSVRCVRNN